MQWDFKNKAKFGLDCSFVLEVPLRYLRPSIIYSVQCDRIIQRVYSRNFLHLWHFLIAFLSPLIQWRLDVKNNFFHK